MRADEFVIAEKKRPKRRPHWAAYGPGPYGGYGYYAGYSGDSGGSDGGGVGEDRDLKELNIAATLKFIKDAHGDQLYGKLPYWRHPRAVAVTGRKIFGSKFDSEAVKTAFLHDVVEDTHVGLDELKKLGFSDQIIDAVSLLTKDKSLNYSDNIQRILRSGNTLAMMVKYADNYENYTGDKSGWTSDRASASNQKYLKSLNILGDVLGVDHHLGEASYEGNVGMMEVSKFFKMATAAQKKLFKELLEKGKRGLAWKLIQDVTDTRLQGREFEIGEDRTADVVFDTGEQRRVRYLPTTKDIVDTIIKYYLKQGLKVVKVDDEEIAWDGANEGWRDTLAGLALGAGVAMGGAQAKGVDTGEKYHGYSEPIQLIQKVDKGDTVYSLAREFGVTPRDIQRVNKLDKDFTIKPGQELAIPEKSKDSAKADFQYKKSDEPKSTTKSLYDNADEKMLLNALVANGFRGAELAAFMAQAAHETRNFGSLVEEGSKRYFMRYDPSSKNPDHKKTARRLGNTKAGDGERFKGRGHLQITGRWNYGAVGRLIGVDLIKNPELLEKPAIAAKASIAFWKMRVQPNVTDYNNVRQVTLPINSGLDKLSQRTSTFKNYKQLLAMK
jgi:putative chitinase